MKKDHTASDLLLAFSLKQTETLFTEARMRPAQRRRRQSVYRIAEALGMSLSELYAEVEGKEERAGG